MVARHRPPHYKFSELVKACRALVKNTAAPVKVFVTDSAIKSSEEFGLGTQRAIINFFSDNIFPEREHESTKELDGEHVDAGITCDAYYFKINPSQHIYFAFYKRRNGHWKIKSFHPPTYGPYAPPPQPPQPLRHTPFAALLEERRQ